MNDNSTLFFRTWFAYNTLFYLFLVFVNLVTLFLAMCIY